MAMYFLFRLAYRTVGAWDGQVGLSCTVLACVCNFLVAFLSSIRRGQIITFREVTHDYIVAVPEPC